MPDGKPLEGLAEVTCRALRLDWWMSAFVQFLAAAPDNAKSPTATS